MGAKPGDQVGSKVVALSNGHFVVASPLWDGSAINTGAVTWVNGNTGFVGAVAARNSLVGTSQEDKVANMFRRSAMATMSLLPHVGIKA